MNGNLTPTSPEDMFPKRFSSSSSNSSSEADDCQIDHDDDVNDDILETLDRKVSEVINRSRLNSSNSSQTMNNTSDKYGPLSFSYNKKNSPSPNKRLSPMMTGASGMVRFGSDDEDNADGGHLTDDSSVDENESRLQWSDDDEEVAPANVPNALVSAASDGTVNNAVFMMRKR